MDLTDRKKTKPAAHRTNIVAADTTADISSSTGALTVEDQLHVACILECSAASVAASIVLALWDKAGTFLGITEAVSMTADGTWRNGAAGPFVTPVAIFDVFGATKVKALVKSLAVGNITNLFLLPLSID